MSGYPILYRKESECCGCTACGAICPQNAIKYEYNKDGFLYPIVDKDKCIQCYQCEAICAFKRETSILPEMNTRVFGVKHKEKMVVQSSSSGGLFTALSDWFLNNGYGVGSCLYDYITDAVIFKIYTDKETRNLAKGSKYIQAELGNSFRDIKVWLLRNKEKKLMIVGTGCQVAGLDSYLSKQKLRDRVFLVDLICHGAASSGLWKQYMKQQKRDKNVQKVTFKDKKYGWHYPRTYAEIDGKQIKIDRFADWFYMGISLRESCYVCPYAKIERVSDITIGDFWGIEQTNLDFYDPNGVSLALVHTKNGMNIFESIKNDIEWFESNKESCSQPRLISPEERPANREQFWNDIRKKGISYCSNEYKRPNTNSISMRLRCKAKNLFFVKKLLLFWRS